MVAVIVLRLEIHKVLENKNISIIKMEKVDMVYENAITMRKQAPRRRAFIFTSRSIYIIK